MNELLSHFDPKQGVTIAEPRGHEPGWWAGAPAAYCDQESGTVYLTYRLRQPRGVQPDRGGTCILARSDDGEHFEPIWQMTRDQLNSPSLERSDLYRLPDGRWALAISYVDGDSNQWRTDLLLAGAPDGFDPAARRKLFLASEIGLAAVKDPVVVRAGGAFLMYLSVAAKRAAGIEPDHSTADAYDTGTILSHTGLATGWNGVDWEWKGLVLEAPDDGGWDSYSVRITSVSPLESGWRAFYDGATGVENHYDEVTGVASSMDLLHWQRLTTAAPALSAPNGRCLRYLDVLRRGDEFLCYYEYGRPDGSHELRLNRLSSGALEAALSTPSERSPGGKQN